MVEVEKPVAKGKGYQPGPLKTKFWGFLCQVREKEVSQGLVSSTLSGLKYIFKILTPPKPRNSVIKKFLMRKPTLGYSERITDNEKDYMYFTWHRNT